MAQQKGVIYILTNPSFPEYVKIGFANDLEKRLKQLNRSETIPYAFRAYAIYEVEGRLTDKRVHKLIDDLNPDLRSVETFDGKKRTKEFFAMSPEEAYAILEAIAEISGTENRLKKLKPEGHEIIDEKEAAEIKQIARRGALKFSDIGIKPGDRLVYVPDDKIQPIVVDDRHIEYDGETTSLSALAKKLKGFNYPVQGTLWFKYNGEILNDMRTRIENKNN